MKVGIITDTHDDVVRVDRAVETFKSAHVAVVLHCGDWVAPFIVRRFKGLKVITILGNNDGDCLALASALSGIEGELKGNFASLELGGKRIAMIHGEYIELVRALAKSGMYDVVVSGHTHEKVFEKIGLCYVVNPGVEEIVLYDTTTDKFEFVPVEASNSVRIRAKYNV